MLTRGILPIDLVVIRGTAILEEQVFSHMMYYHADETQENRMTVDCTHKDVTFQPGTYGTDASGGMFGSYEFRRCTCGIVSVCPPTLEVECRLSFTLAGDVQTVPRAELYMLLRHWLWVLLGLARSCQ